ncbi:sigma-70 family RNA polymerase sigma factor [Sinomonas halotolerans]|uniref:Sigma-70 family RNA polymerase sigma factor n=1 Tax=Sinomonas halotolerans TaxID=1644133 RepID=A0ABU9X100_9MICC
MTETLAHTTPSDESAADLEAGSARTTWTDRDEPSPSWPAEQDLGLGGEAEGLALEHLGVADALARRFKCPGHDADDLRQVARLGLIKAAKRYEEGKGHGFVAFAAPTITGELKRYVRDHSWVVRPPRSIQELRLRLRGVRPALAQRLGHDPSTAELSRELGAGLAEVAEAQIAEAAMVAEQIDDGDTSRSDDGVKHAVAFAADDPGYEQVETRLALAAALEDLSERDRRILYLRFHHEMTQSQIAKELGVSQMQVSRLLNRVLGQLRTRMAA